MNAAISKALTSGGTIRLHPADYGEYTVFNKHFASPVTLIAAGSVPPTFRSLSISSSSNISVAGVHVTGVAQPLMSVSSSRNVVLADNKITGANQNSDPWDDNNTGLRIRFSSNVAAVNNLFEDVRIATFIQRSQNVGYEFNTIRFVREGLNVAATHQLRIANNHMHSFFPIVANGEHPDGIQFWTSNETVGSSDVTISENALMFGGCRAVQGIFIRSETEGKTTVAQIRHARFTIERNVYYGSARNGLSISSVDDAVIRNNVIVNSPYAETGISRTAAQASDPRCSGALSAGILSRFGSTTHQFANNVTHVLGSTEGARSNDVWISSTSGISWLDLVNERPRADVPALEEFVTKSPSVMRSRGVGLLAPYPHGQQNWAPATAQRRGASVLLFLAAQKGNSGLALPLR